MKRNKFSLSHTKLFSCDMGQLIPVGLVEVIPGDSMQHATTALLRCSPLLAPVMHPVDVRIHHWYVPHRLVWEDWEEFITGGPDGMDASVFPFFDIGTDTIFPHDLCHYLGVPLGVYAAGSTISALPLRGYQLIWNEWYRDQDLENAIAIDTSSGEDSGTSWTELHNCAWEKDYLTSARPWEQKGPSITLPLGTTAPVTFREGAATRTLNRDAATSPTALRVVGAGTAGATITAATDLSTASAVTVNVLREALALQRFEEARARYGSRYTEYLRYLGVRSSDARLQRPEYLGGGRETIQFSEVLQTAEGTDPVGELRGHGLAAMRSNRYRRFFEEHGYVFSLMSVRPKTIYVNSLERTWNRRTKEDFWQRELEHIGQQEILNKEVYATHATPNGVFGYQDRYDEYRRQESKVCGEFATSALNHWHFARAFGSAPALNADFVKCVPTEVPFAVNSEDVLWVMAKHSIQARRLVSASGRSFIF